MQETPVFSPSMVYLHAVASNDSQSQLMQFSEALEKFWISKGLPVYNPRKNSGKILFPKEKRNERNENK